ncbi:hypothetical protein CDD83_10862 [Cordyceps sp. RAO-2017]|nr:hypothetical protein CDD83_10862 [Cordyceps sp. RAO-2017]
MPRKRQQARSFKPFSVTAAPAPAPSADKPPASVNQLLANLRRASAAPSAPAPVPASGPSLPPTIREVLRLPETPAPLPRRPPRQRFDDRGRRLPAGPAPPRSWVSGAPAGATSDGSPRASARLGLSGPARTALPVAYLPARGSLIDLALRRLALDWELHRVYNQYHLDAVPSHLKPALIRYVSVARGVTTSDLKAVLLPAGGGGAYGEEDEEVEELGPHSASNPQVSCLDLSGSLGRSLSLRGLSRLLFPPSRRPNGPEAVRDAWDAADPVPSPPRTLLPNLTHLSLALDPCAAGDVPWKQLLALSLKLSTVTHLSLAFWPVPCLTPPLPASIQDAGRSPGAARLSADRDWSEALLVLKMLSKRLYRLEYLDLTGCVSWFDALAMESGHDRVDWVWSWGKISHLRLFTGWTPDEDAPPSEQLAHREAASTARRVERHIIAQRAGRALPMTVERDAVETSNG